MFSLIRRKTPFQRALESYGLGRCSVRTGQIWIGLGPDAEYGRVPLEALPEAPQSVLFLRGPEQAELVAALGKSAQSKTLGHLMIGTSHDFAKTGGPMPPDMGGATAAFGAAQWPALNRLSLGAMEQLFNGHVYLGGLGDTTAAFEAAPALQKLDLSGCFSLARPVRHGTLSELTVTLDDVGMSGGPLTQASVDNLLSSHLPRLRSLSLDLEEEGAAPYSIPEAFYGGESFPALERCFVNMLAPDAEARLADWKRQRGIGW